MIDDILTQRHAFIVARDYNLAPYDDMKTERVLGDDGINSVWLATKDRSVRCFVKYQQDDLEPQE